MKRVWENPKIYVEKFTPNEYVAACHDTNTVYKFTCNAGDGVYGSVYLETNNTPGLQTGRNGDQRIARYQQAWGQVAGYHACGITHEASTNDDFLDGYYCAEGDTNNPVNVIVWRGPRNDNVHCTTNVDMSTWEVDRS